MEAKFSACVNLLTKRLLLLWLLALGGALVSFGQERTAIEGSAQAQSYPSQSGLLRISLRFLVQEAAAKTGNYEFQIPADGSMHRLEFGSRIPIQTSINNTITQTYVSAGTLIEISARLVKKAEETDVKSYAWIELKVQYDRVLERLATFSSQPTASYIDTTQFDTALLVPEGMPAEVFGYSDEVVGRTLTATLSWSQIVPPQEGISNRPPSVETIRCLLSFTDQTSSGTRAVKQWIVIPVDGKDHSFLAGVRIPVSTSINNTISTQFVNISIGGTVRVFPSTASTPRLLVPQQRFAVQVRYERLRERPFATRAELPYSESVNFEGFPRLTENQDEILYVADEAVRGKIFRARFSWQRWSP